MMAKEVEAAEGAGVPSVNPASGWLKVSANWPFGSARTTEPWVGLAAWITRLVWMVMVVEARESALCVPPDVMEADAANE